MDKDQEHLKILSICYYISAGLTAFFSLFPLLYVVMGIVFVSVDLPRKANEPSPALIGGFLIVIGALVSLIGWAIAFGCFLAAKRLKEQRSYIFCIVMGAINCLFFPLGMILGVFTFIVLGRDSVRLRFDKIVAAQPTTFNNPSGWR